MLLMLFCAESRPDTVKLFTFLARSERVDGVKFKIILIDIMNLSLYISQEQYAKYGTH